MPASFTFTILSCHFCLLPNLKQNNKVIPTCSALLPAPPPAPLAGAYPSVNPSPLPQSHRDLTQEHSSCLSICMTDGSFALPTSSHRSPVHPSGILWGYLLPQAAFHPLTAHPCPHSYVLPAKHRSDKLALC